jgi:hypothetical protein
MASHFACLGFGDGAHLPDQDRLISEILDGERTRTDAGTYVRRSSGSGAELWLQLDPTGEIIGLNPHFSGHGSMRARLLRVISRQDESPLDGAFYAWSDPRAEQDPESGEYPFVFDCPDARLHTSLALPRIVTVQLAAFAHELAAYADDTAFAKAQAQAPGFAPESVIPAGLFTSDGNTVPTAHAIFAGHVRRAERRRNAFTGSEFWWALVETLGGTIDVIAEPDTIVGSLQIGGVAQGTFWLSGRIKADFLTVTE